MINKKSLSFLFGIFLMYSPLHAAHLNIANGKVLKDRQIGNDTIIFIKEHYGNGSVESEVFGILEDLVENHGLRMVGVERATGEVKTMIERLSKGAMKLEFIYRDEVLTYGIEEPRLYEFTMEIINLLQRFVENHDYQTIETIKHGLSVFEKKSVGDMFDGKDDLEKIMKYADSIIVDKRSYAFVDNLLEKMHESNIKISALVAGGDHEESIKSVLEEKGISYTIIEPNSYR